MTASGLVLLVMLMLVLKLLLLLILGDAAKGSQTRRIASPRLDYWRLKLLLIWLPLWAIHHYVRWLLRTEEVLLSWASWRRLRHGIVVEPLLIGCHNLLLGLVLILGNGLLMSLAIVRRWKVYFWCVLGQRLHLLVVVHKNVRWLVL